MRMCWLVLLFLPTVAGFSSPAQACRAATRVRGPSRICLSTGSDKSKPGDDAKIAAAIGLSGLAGSATVASTATTLATAAGGACAGGACAAGAGALAGGSGGAAAMAATGGGLLAGAKGMLFAGMLFASAALNTAMGTPTLETMVRVSTPLEAAIGNGRPTVMEFYGNACPHCRSAAKELSAVEERAVRDKGINWVMINTDDPSMAPVWNMYHVDEIPHFEFFDAAGDEVGFEIGAVDAQTIERRMAEAVAHAHAAPAGMTSPMTS